jgi:hypothetical protein
MIGSKKPMLFMQKAKFPLAIGVKNDKLLDAMNRLAKLPLIAPARRKMDLWIKLRLVRLSRRSYFRLNTEMTSFGQGSLKPLGMKDSYFNVPSEKANRLVNLYTEDSLGHLQKAGSNMLNGPITSAYPLTKSTYFSGGCRTFYSQYLTMVSFYKLLPERRQIQWPTIARPEYRENDDNETKLVTFHMAIINLGSDLKW